jgi:hypothetical protein
LLDVAPTCAWCLLLGYMCVCVCAVTRAVTRAALVSHMLPWCHTCCPGVTHAALVSHMLPWCHTCCPAVSWCSWCCSYPCRIAIPYLPPAPPLVPRTRTPTPTPSFTYPYNPPPLLSRGAPGVRGAAWMKVRHVMVAIMATVRFRWSGSVRSVHSMHGHHRSGLSQDAGASRHGHHSSTHAVTVSRAHVQLCPPPPLPRIHSGIPPALSLPWACTLNARAFGPLHRSLPPSPRPITLRTPCAQPLCNAGVGKTHDYPGPGCCRRGGRGGPLPP